MAELEPCPFCKGEAVMVRQRKKGRTRDVVNAFARCKSCGARSKNVSTLHVAERNLETYAARAWNARWERTCRLVRHDGCKSNGWWTCSECGARINGHPLSNPDKYCGRCGAKVVER